MLDAWHSGHYLGEHIHSGSRCLMKGSLGGFCSGIRIKKPSGSSFGDSCSMADCVRGLIGEAMGGEDLSHGGSATAAAASCEKGFCYGSKPWSQDARDVMKVETMYLQLLHSRD